MGSILLLLTKNKAQKVLILLLFKKFPFFQFLRAIFGSHFEIIDEFLDFFVWKYNISTAQNP